MTTEDTKTVILEGLLAKLKEAITKGDHDTAHALATIYRLLADACA